MHIPLIWGAMTSRGVEAIACFNTLFVVLAGLGRQTQTVLFNQSHLLACVRSKLRTPLHTGTYDVYQMKY